MFHFRIKSDKKPDGSKISAVHHVDYIRREGVFFDIDRQPVNANFVHNLIYSAEIKDACGGLDSLLYRTTDFGCIKNSSDGIELSDNSAPTTISIALLIADKVMNHQHLIISGSADFKKSVINAAISDDLPVSFADLSLQNLFMHQKELIENHSETQGTDLIERKKLVERTADKIIENINANVTQLSAKAHVEYINREKTFAKRGGCIFKAHRLPKCANDAQKKFFHDADKYEGCGNRRYVEIEFALPNELTTV